MKSLINKNVYYSISLSVLIFIVFLSICKPIINSDDNFYILYTLGGGYGNRPTNLLHYYYEWHPLLFWPIAKLFDKYPNFNWYSALLLILQFISYTNILYLLLSILNRSIASGIYFIFFLFFSSTLLLSLNHSNTSFTLAISGCSSFLIYSVNPNFKSTKHLKKLIFPSILLVISCMLRLHTFALCILLSFGIGVVLLPLGYLKNFSLSVTILGIILLLFIQGHIYYYEKSIPNSNKEESFRQSLFYIANHPIESNVQDTGMIKIKNSFIQSWFIYDTSFISNNDIKRFIENRAYNRINKSEEFKLILYWTYKNNRVYLLLFSTIIMIFISLKSYRSLLQWLLMSLTGIMAFLYLQVYMKVTEGIFITILSSIFIAAVLCLRKEKIKFVPIHIVFLIPICLSSFWMVISIKKKNDNNVYHIEQTRSILKELNDNRNCLFVNTNEFDDNGYYIWDTPKQYPIINLINKELLITNSYEQVLHRFHINNLMKSLLVKRNVFVSGSNQPLLKEYYWIKHRLNVDVVKVKKFKYLNTYQIKFLSTD